MMSPNRTKGPVLHSRPTDPETDAPSVYRPRGRMNDFWPPYRPTAVRRGRVPGCSDDPPWTGTDPLDHVPTDRGEASESQSPG